MPAIFISHSSKDGKSPATSRLRSTRLGFEQVFLDFDKETGLDIGENWEKRLYEELTRCHAVVLVLTPAWLASKWCFAELTQARALGKVILPVMCEPLGGQFVLPDIQAVDLVDWNAGGLERSRSGCARSRTSWRAASRSIRTGRPIRGSTPSRRRTRRSISAATRRAAPSSSGSMRGAPRAARAS